jgi:hypothetical protein
VHARLSREAAVWAAVHASCDTPEMPLAISMMSGSGASPYGARTPVRRGATMYIGGGIVGLILLILLILWLTGNLG